MITLNNIVNKLRAFADAHHFIREFSEGDVEDLLADKEHEYPLMHVVYTGSNVAEDEKGYDFRIFVVDVTQDKKGNAVRDIREAISDAEQCIEDLYADITNGHNVFPRDDYEIDDLILNPVEQETSQVASGVDAQVTIRVEYDASSCNAPLISVTPQGDGCVFNPITLINSDGDTVFNAIESEPSDGNHTLNDVQFRDESDEPETYPAPDVIQLPNSPATSVQVVNGTMTINTPAIVSSSGIAYPERRPLLIGGVSYTPGDSPSRFFAGEYSRNNPAYPEHYAEVDENATQADVRGTPATGTSLTDTVAPTILKNNNHFGNRYRLTDDQGNPSDAPVGGNIYAHTNFRDHSYTGATANYMIDNASGWGYYVRYMLDGSKFNLDAGATGQSWEDWMAFINGLGTFAGYDDWMPLDLSDLDSPIGVVFMDQSDNNQWGRNILTFESTVIGSERGAAVTGESRDASNYWLMNDNGNTVFTVTAFPKLNNGQFQNRLANIFIKRKHF